MSIMKQLVYRIVGSLSYVVELVPNYHHHRVTRRWHSALCRLSAEAWHAHNDARTVVYTGWKTVNGFTVQDGFIGILEKGQLIYVTSGWIVNNHLYIYTEVDGVWSGHWLYIPEAGAEFQETIRLAQEKYEKACA